MIQTESKVIHFSDEVKFEKELNALLAQGWQILSCSCGFIPSEEYNFCGWYQAILVKTINPSHSPIRICRNCHCSPCECKSGLY